jgi:hemerythrin
MAKNSIVKWQNSFSVGIRLIDEQHMQLIRLTNKLFASCMAGRDQSKNTFLNVASEAINYTGYHFGVEEKIMERVNYPGFQKHKQEHANFVREVFTKMEEFKANKPRAPLGFVYFLKDWVLHHIAVNDKKLGAYLVNMYRDGSLQRITLQVKKNNAMDRFLIK